MDKAKLQEMSDAELHARIVYASECIKTLVVSDEDGSDDAANQLREQQEVMNEVVRERSSGDQEDVQVDAQPIQASGQAEGA